MTLNELIERLQEIHEQNPDADPEIRLASQPSWPMQHGVGAIELGADGVVYIAEGDQDGYLTQAGSQAVGWSRG